MSTDIIVFLKSIPLFEGANTDILCSLLDKDLNLREYSSGEEIPFFQEKERNLVIIYRGKATVHSADTERKVLLRTLGEGDVFGVSELFGNDDGNISRVSAKGKCSVILIPEKEIGYLLENDKRFMYNYLHFLCQRIRFLGKRIACFTAGSAERRLALYLDSIATENGGIHTARVSSMEALSRTLDIGRASLYRALDTLTEDGFIQKDGKELLLPHRKKMTEFYNK